MPFTPSWYPPITLGLNLYALVVSVIFLAWFRPRTQRNIWAVGIFGVGVYILANTLRGLSRFRPGGVMARFTSELDAITAFAPVVIGSVVVTILLVAQQRDRHRRRRGLEPDYP